MSHHENLTIVFTDIVGFSKLTSECTRAQMRRLMMVHDETLLPIIAAFGGKHIKSIGDAFLLSFRSPTDAVLCGMAIQDALAQQRLDSARNAQADELPLHVRVAISLGEVRVERRDIFGEAVNIAARVEAITPADEVYLTESVYLAMSKADVEVRDVGSHELRGVARPVRVYSAAYAAEDQKPEFAHLPYGGAHLRRPAKPSLLMRGRAMVRSTLVTQPVKAGRSLLTGLAAAAGAGVAAVVLTVAITSVTEGELTAPIPAATANSEPAQGELSLPEQPKLVVARSDVRKWLDEGAKVMASGNAAAREKYLEAGFADPDLKAAAALLQGHLRFEQGAYKAGIASYAGALAEPKLSVNDQRMAANLVSVLSQHTAEVERLLRAHQSPAIIAALAKRSGEAGFYGRHHAVRVLEAMQRNEAVRWFDYAVEEVRGRSECEDRLAAVNILGELGDPRAIPILDEARGDGLKGWLKNRCLRSAAGRWIKKLEDAQS